MSVRPSDDHGGFNVHRAVGKIAFVVRCGDGSPYDVYLATEEAEELATAVQQLTTKPTPAGDRP